MEMDRNLSLDWSLGARIALRGVILDIYIPFEYISFLYASILYVIFAHGERRSMLWRQLPSDTGMVIYYTDTECTLSTGFP